MADWTPKYRMFRYTAAETGERDKGWVVYTPQAFGFILTVTYHEETSITLIATCFSEMYAVAVEQSVDCEQEVIKAPAGIENGDQLIAWFCEQFPDDLRGPAGEAVFAMTK